MAQDIIDRLVACDCLLSSNLLLYGRDANTKYHIVSELIKSLNNGKTPYMSCESVNSGYAFVKNSALHHEFDFAACYNSATATDLVARVLQLSSYKRFQGKKHIILLHNVDAMSHTQVNRLKHAVTTFSDRTCFVFTTGKMTLVPGIIVHSCICVRCACPTVKPSGVLYDRLYAMVSHVLARKNVNTDAKVAAAFVAFREFAYTCIGYNVGLAYVSRTILDVLSDLKQTEALPDVVGILASHEAASNVMKRDVLAWEAAFIKIVRRLMMPTSPTCG